MKREGTIVALVLIVILLQVFTGGMVIELLDDKSTERYNEAVEVYNREMGFGDESVAGD